MDLRLKDKVVLTTASSRGLGYATALALAREGARVALCSRNQESIHLAARQIAAETGVETLPIAADVSHAAEIEQLVAATFAHFGRIDGLFINAGGPKPGNFASLELEDWEAALSLTVQSVVRLCYAVIPIMRQQGGGSILANTSVTVRMPLEGLTLSNSLRAAVVGLVKTLSIEVGGDNIRVNAIAPGWTRTERVEEILRARAESHGAALEEEAAQIARDVPLRRMGLPEEFACAAAFLLSPAASYITGVTLLVDGGMAKSTL